MGMPNIVFRCQMFRGDWDQIWSQMRMLWMMEGLCRVNQTHLRQFDEFRRRGLVPRGYPSVYRSGLHYETEKGTEIWPDIPSLLMGTMGKGVYPGPWGDCLPVSTLVLMRDYTVKAIGSLVPGEVIMGDGGFTTVVQHAVTGEKPILEFELDNGSVLRCSPEHRVFLHDNTEKRAEAVSVGDHLRTPTSEFPTQEISREYYGLDPRDLAWLTDVYVADGWNEVPRHRRFAISGKDECKKEEQKQKVKAMLEKVGIGTRWNERYIAVNHAPLAELMHEHGSHAPEKHLPSLLWGRNQVESLLEGLAADASTATSGTRTHGTTSEILALQLRILYRMLGQSVHIKRWDEHGGLGTHPMYRITVRMPSDPAWPNSRRDSARVKAIRECEPELCCDITTDTGRFYLPESDVIVHNCEDLACYRVAELRELPYHFERTASWDSKKTEVADPRYPPQDVAQSVAPLSSDAKQNPFTQPVSKQNPFAEPGLRPNPFTDSSVGEVATWPGWRRVEGGIKAKPFAKWRRGPRGNYHYHALTYLPDGRLEDPSLGLGMGREAAFARAGLAMKLKNFEVSPIIQYAKAPEVMVVDPEKPSGYGGGIAPQLDEKVKNLLAQRGDNLDGISGGLEVGAYLHNEIMLGETEFDVDKAIGWSREHKMFVARDEKSELGRLLGYAEH